MEAAKNYKLYKVAYYTCSYCGAKREPTELRTPCAGCGSLALEVTIQSVAPDPRRPFGTTREVAHPQ